MGPGLSLIGSYMGLGDRLRPSEVLDVLTYHREEKRAESLDYARTLFNMGIIKEKGGEFTDVIGHLQSPAEARELARARELELSRRRVQYFEQMARAWRS